MQKFLWSPHGSASSWIALNNWRGLNKIPWRKYEIVWSKSITSEPASAVGKSPVILPIIKPASTCVGKVIWNHQERIKKFSSPKIKIWFEPMFFSGFFCGFERCGSPPAPRLRRAGAAFPNFRGGFSLRRKVGAKCVRTNSRILHHVGKVKKYYMVRRAGLAYYIGRYFSTSLCSYGKVFRILHASKAVCSLRRIKCASLTLCAGQDSNLRSPKASRLQRDVIATIRPAHFLIFLCTGVCALGSRAVFHERIFLYREFS